MVNSTNVLYLQQVSLLLAPFPSLSGAIKNSTQGVENSTEQQDDECSGCHTIILSGLNGSRRLERNRNGQTAISLSCEGCRTRTSIIGKGEGKDAFKKIQKKKLLELEKRKWTVLSEPELPLVLPKALPVQEYRQSTPLQSVAPLPLTLLSTPSTPSSKAVNSTTLESSSTTESGKKRKRSNKSTGLAQLLEEKRKKSEITKQNSLLGFLNGI